MWLINDNNCFLIFCILLKSFNELIEIRLFNNLRSFIFLYRYTSILRKVVVSINIKLNMTVLAVIDI